MHIQRVIQIDLLIGLINLMTYISSVLDHLKDSSLSFNYKEKDMATPVQ
jgi:hypothetical protein